MTTCHDHHFPSNIGTTSYRVLHETQYHYAYPVSLSQQLLHLRPRTFEFQDCQQCELDINPTPSDWLDQQDYFGNGTRHITILAPHQQLLVRASSTVLLFPRPYKELFNHTLPWETMRDKLRGNSNRSLLEPAQFLFESPHIACNTQLFDYAASSFTPQRPLFEAALDLTQRIHRDFEFDPEATTIATPLAEVLAGRRGVCQDFAHLMIGCLRSHSLACRYVSGYILTHPPKGQPRLIGADASHAWVSVYCDDFGWIDFDPTNKCVVQNEHITLGWGRDFSDVTPMRGIVLGGGEQELKVSVTVTPLSNTNPG